MRGLRTDDPKHRVYEDTRMTITRRGFLMYWPTDPEERVMLIGNWIIMLRYRHAVCFDHLWRVIEQEFPHEVERARKKIAEIDKSLKADPFVE